MQELIIRNVKNAAYRETSLNEIYDPNAIHNHSFGFQSSAVKPYVSGEGKLSVAFYILQPGKCSYPFHYHTGKEECFYIIQGTATLITSDGDTTVSEGDVIVMPANEKGAHMLKNTSDAPLVYIDIGAGSSPDVVVYPHSGKLRVCAGEIQKSYRIEAEVNYLDRE